MVLLIVGVAIFLGIHALPWNQSARQSLIDKFGFKAYRGIFSLLALSGLILIVVGKAYADFQSLYAPPVWGRSLALPLMFFAMILVPAANFPNNIKRRVRHPMLIGIILWSAAHLLANGDVASVVLFGSFGLYSIVAIISANKRGKSSNLPTVAVKMDMIAVVIGVAAFAILLFAHPYLFGVPVIV